MIRNGLEDLYEYAELHSSHEGELLIELERKTYLHALSPQMVSGKLQGKFLSLISKLKKPKHVLDIGSFTGYSCLCLAQGLQADGVIHTMDVNDDYEYMRSEFFNKSIFKNNIIQHIGDALDIIPTLDISWDIVFIDANKKAYPLYYDILKNKMITGSILICDNMLWSGKVLEEKKDEETAALDFLNQKIRDEKLFDVVLLPLRDGISLAIKN